MTTPKEDMIATLDSLGAANDGQGLPPWSESTHHIFSVRSVEALLPIIAKHQQRVAQEMRALSIKYRERKKYAGISQDFAEGLSQAFEQAAQMLEERLNG